MATKRPTGDAAIEALASYVAALTEADLPAVQEIKTRVNWEDRWDCAAVRPVADYIHGLSCHRTEDMWRRSLGVQDDTPCVTVHVSQYLTNCPVQGHGRTAAEALAALKRSWGSLEAARATLAAKGWGPSHPGTFAHPAYSS